MPRPEGGYKLADGTKVPGVTTIISRFKESGALIHWAWSIGIKGEDYRKVRDTAAGIGTVVHDMIENWLRGPPVAVPQSYLVLDPESASKADQSFKNFVSWWESSVSLVIGQEQSLVSEYLKYGGTIDVVAMVNQKRTILDWKTSNAVYTEHLIQLAAYRRLWNENFPDTPINGGVHLLRFAKEHGDFTHHYFADVTDAERAFVLMRELYNLDKSLKKRIA